MLDNADNELNIEHKSVPFSYKTINGNMQCRHMQYLQCKSMQIVVDPHNAWCCKMESVLWDLAVWNYIDNAIIMMKIVFYKKWHQWQKTHYWYVVIHIKLDNLPNIRLGFVVL